MIIIPGCPRALTSNQVETDAASRTHAGRYVPLHEATKKGLHCDWDTYACNRSKRLRLHQSMSGLCIGAASRLVHSTSSRLLPSQHTNHLL
eukprot:876265-Pleurochrysis_carterae.AAC.2